MPSINQSSTATLLIQQSILLQLFGVTWGFVVPATPFPRLALVPHLQAITSSTMFLSFGLLLYTDFLTLPDIGCWFMKWSMITDWAIMLVEVLNAWWGTKDLLALVSFFYPSI